MGKSTAWGRIPVSVHLGQLFQATLAGGLAGAAAGVVARGSMRAVALLAGLETDFSLEGTFFILLAFAMLGILLGWFYAGIARWVGRRGGWLGAAFGATLLLAAAILLLTADNLEGELGAISPWAIIWTFTPVFLVFGFGLGALYDHNRLAWLEAADRRVGLGWLSLFGAVVVVQIAGLATLNDLGLPSPRAMAGLYRVAGVSYQAARALRELSILFLGIAFLGTTGWLFFSQSASWMPRFAALGLLTFGAGFFASRDVFLSLLGPGDVARWVGGLFRAAGLTGLVVWIYLFPDGRFTIRWTRLAAALWFTVALVWLLPIELPVSLPDSVLAGWVLLGLGSGVLAQWQRYRRLDTPTDRKQVAPVVRGLTGHWLLVAVIWVTAISIPTFRAIGSPSLPLSRFFAYGPYLLPWLLIPISVLYARRRGLWQPSSGAGGSFLSMEDV